MWIDLGQLDGCRAGYGLPIPADQGSALRVAAAEHHRALAPAGLNAAHAVLVALRSSTIACSDTEDEALASYKLLRSHMADVPLDILEAACRAYCIQPGRRFYPRAAGELRAFTDPMIRRRAARAAALLRMAAMADEADAEARRLADDPLTPEMAAAIRAEYAPARSSSAVTSTPAVADVAAYMSLGLDEADAQRAVADHRRMLSRSPARAPDFRRVASEVAVAA